MKDLSGAGRELSADLLYHTGRERAMLCIPIHGGMQSALFFRDDIFLRMHLFCWVVDR